MERGTTLNRLYRTLNLFPLPAGPPGLAGCMHTHTHAHTLTLHTLRTLRHTAQLKPVGRKSFAGTDGGTPSPVTDAGRLPRVYGEGLHLEPLQRPARAPACAMWTSRW